MPDGNEIRSRAIWSGTITFGLVSVPVNLFPGNRSEHVSLRMLDEDGTPLARRYYCPSEHRALDSDEVVRGYEVAPGKFVVVEDEELEAIEPRKSRDIDLRQFVPVEQVDPIYFERAYFLAPDGSTKAYRLLAETMEQTGRVGIATFVMRDKEYLVAIIAENGILRAETLRFADEIRAPSDVGLPEVDSVPSRTVRRIEQDIAKHTEPRLSKAELKDRHAERLLALAEKKRKRHEDVVEVPVEEEEEEGAEIIDLVEILRRSMSEREARGRARPAKRAGGSARKATRKAVGSTRSASRTGTRKAAGRSTRKTTRSGSTGTRRGTKKATKRGTKAA